MASERSIYRKIQILLDLLRTSSIKDLVNDIEVQRIDVFFTRQYKKDRDEFVKDVSHASISRVVGVCKILGLVSEGGQLTTDGREAYRRSRYDDVIRRRVWAVFKERGIKAVFLNAAIRSMLKADPPSLPTSLALWETAESDIPYALFAQLLRLLAQAGGAISAQKRIFLQLTIH